MITIVHKLQLQQVKLTISVYSSVSQLRLQFIMFSADKNKLSKLN